MQLPPAFSENCHNYDSRRCRSCARLAYPPAERFAGKYERLVQTARDHFGAAVQVAPLWVPATVFPSRTKAKMSVSGPLDAPCLGIIDNQFQGQELLDCPLHLPIINRTLVAIRALIPKFKLFPYDIENRTGELKGLILRASRDSSQILARFVVRSTESLGRLQKAADELMQAIPEIISVSANIQPIPHAILEGETETQIAGSPLLWETYNGIELAFGPRSFSQVTPETAEALYRHVATLAAKRPAQHVLDLYCGVGGFSLHIAPHTGRVTGVELSEQAIACANLAADRNAIKNATFLAGDVAEFLATGSTAADAVVCNPPRRGLSAGTVAALNKLAPATIWYSSCNPETLFRDIALLADYRISSLAPFEMFPLTEHLEVVAELTLVS